MKILKYLSLLFIATLPFWMACKPEYTELDTYPTPDASTVSFTKTKIDDFHYKFTNTSTTVGNALWTLGNGAIATGNEVIAEYLDIDDYTIEMKLVAKGGIVTKSMTHSQLIADPVKGNKVLGAKFKTQDDVNKWTILNVSGATWALGNGVAKITNVAGSWGQAGIYQPIQVEAGKTYIVDLYFQTTGATGGWFKVYTCLTAPVQGKEYTDPILVTEVPIWKDWNVSSGPVQGLLSVINNPDSGLKSGCKVTFNTTGTIYLLLQCGANSLNDGVTVTNVQFRQYITSK